MTQNIFCDDQNSRRDRSLQLSYLALFALLTVGLGLLACGGPDERSGEAPGDRPLRVLATTGMIADLAGRVAGDLAEVDALMGPGIDPHLYKASESDVRRLTGADLVLYNGLYLEGKMGEVLDKLGRSRPVVAIAEEIDPSRLLEAQVGGSATGAAPSSTPGAGHPDPHLWFDTALWTETLEPITEALVDRLPEHEATLRANADATRAELLALDAWVAERISEIPEEHRVLVTAHDAFGYFGRRYGIEVIGIQGISTVAEAGLQDVERVVDLLVERRVPALFVESSVPRRTVEAVREAVRRRGHEVAVGGELYSDAMGAAGTEEGTYPGMVRSNVDTIVEALRGEGEE